MSEASGDQAPPAIEIAGLRRSFHDGERERLVLDGLELTIHVGELVAIVGSSGSGKTTLLNAVGALDARFEGEIRVYGQSIRALDDDGRCELRNQRIGFVFQSYHLLEHLSVLDNVKVPLWLDGGVPESEADRMALASLDEVGLKDRAHADIGPLSGGERQRVAIARALVHAPRLVLADEPTGNLDAKTGRGIYELFDRIRSRAEDGGCAVLIVTHDPRLFERVDRVLELYEGRLREVASP